MQALNSDEARQVLAAAKGDDLEALWWLALTAGIRQGELLALRWPDVDVDRGSLRIVASLVRVAGQEPPARGTQVKAIAASGRALSGRD